MIKKGRRNRRAILRNEMTALAAVGGFSGRIGASSANEREDAQERAISRRIYERSLRLREQADWDIHTWRRWLANHGFEFRYDDTETSFDSNDELNTQARSEHDITLYLTYTRGRDTDYINVEWELNDGWLSYAEPPKDLVSISFGSDYYNFTDSEKMSCGSWVDPAEQIDALGHNYRVVAYNDDAHALRTSGKFGSWFDAKLYPTGGTRRTRQIYLDYVHRWEDVAPTGMGVDSSGGMTITFGSSSGQWRAETFTSEDKMDNGDSFVDDSPE